MKVSELGEFGLIERLKDELGSQDKAKAVLGPHSQLLLGIGDDAALWKSPSTAQLATTDTMVAGIHFPEEGIGWRDLGWKVMAANVSDIAAMGGRPEFALATLGLPADFLVEDVVAIYKGMAEAGREYGVLIAGGDMVRSQQVVLTVALLGQASQDPRGEPQVLSRDCAGAGDLIAVSGTLGNSAGGLRSIVEGKATTHATADFLRRAHLRPRPHVDLGQSLIRGGIRCAIDISDGLAQDLRHVCEASKLSATVRLRDLPLSDHLRRAFPDEATEMAVSGGEDYELLFTGPANLVDRIRGRFAIPITVIGVMEESGEHRVRFVDDMGAEVSFAKGGWDHFADKSLP